MTLIVRQFSDIFGNGRGVKANASTGCMHGKPKLRASNDCSGEREYFGLGGERRRSPTGGLAKGIPEDER